MAWWLGFWAFIAVTRVQSLVRELRGMSAWRGQEKSHIEADKSARKHLSAPHEGEGSAMAITDRLKELPRRQMGAIP